MFELLLCQLKYILKRCIWLSAAGPKEEALQSKNKTSKLVACFGPGDLVGKEGKVDYYNPKAVWTFLALYGPGQAS
jgi:hypothetical protein